MPTRILGVIPARYDSSRFPGKALITIAGKSMLQHVYERSSQARYLSQIIIATDDQRIYDEARRFGAPVRMTRRDHLSGTDRAAEIASTDGAGIVVNIQGDEPLIDPAAVDAAVLCLLDDPTAPMSTLKKKIDDPEEIHNPNIVKVVTGHNDTALYFSRLPIPAIRASGGEAPLSKKEPTPWFKHIGLYVYRREFLLSYPDLRVGPLERAERLEQLRALENGFSIRVAETEYESIGIDTPEDYERVSKLFSLSPDV